MFKMLVFIIIIIEGEGKTQYMCKCIKTKFLDATCILSRGVVSTFLNKSRNLHLCVWQGLAWRPSLDVMLMLPRDSPRDAKNSDESSIALGSENCEQGPTETLFLL